MPKVNNRGKKSPARTKKKKIAGKTEPRLERAASVARQPAVSLPGIEPRSSQFKEKGKHISLSTTLPSSKNLRTFGKN